MSLCQKSTFYTNNCEIINFFKMNILFLTLSRFESIEERGIYSDLMREFVRRGNDVYIASPTERRFGKPTHLNVSDNYQILKIKTLNIQKTNIIEKGIGTLLLEYQFDKAIRKYWGNIQFDLVLYSTPPITFNKVIERVKKRCNAKSYLMLKDIFPQNAVDLGMMKKGSILYNMFRKKERRLYQISGTIGCMSPANCEYVLVHNPEVKSDKVEVCPNAVEPHPLVRISKEDGQAILAKLDIPSDKRIFVYGGNLGKPQGVDFLLKAVEENEQNNDSFIVIVGNGTEYPKLENWFKTHNPVNARLLARLPKEDYDRFVKACDAGLIFLDRRFTIPNFPSRLLSYLENAMPVLLATDVNTDMGRIAEKKGFGLWCESGDLNGFMKNMETLASNPSKILEMGERGRKFLEENYTTKQVADIILKTQKSY